MASEVKVPAVGESITEGILEGWEKSSGDLVAVDDPLFVLETDKVTMTINAESAGRLEILAEPGETVQVGQVVARIAAADGDGGAAAAADSEAPPQTAPPPKEDPPTKTPPPDVKAPAADGRALDGLSPAVRRLVAEHNLDPRQLTGSGRGGRITKEDVQKHLERKAPAASSQTATPEPSAPAVTPMPKPSPTSVRERQTRSKMSSLRKRIAERLVQSQQTAAILTTFNEVDMTNIMAWRARYKETFKERYDVNLGFMSFFLKASVNALQTVPALNGYIDGDDIVQNHFYDIGVAVGTERGLIVPVVRNVDQLSFAEVELSIADFARRAREKSITLDDLSGGSFTVSNGGVYGSLLSTPILNPPQSGILGMHGIKKRPVAVGDEIEIRPMMYLALSYDHRIIDGSESVTFLKRIVECIENPERMMLEI